MFLTSGLLREAKTSTPNTKAESQSRTLMRLKRAIRKDETPIRWIDFFAAETAMQQARAAIRANISTKAGGASSQMNDSAAIDADLESSLVSSEGLAEAYCEQLFDCVLVLSYVTSLGKQALSTSELLAYQPFFAFHWQAEPQSLSGVLSAIADSEFTAALGRFCPVRVTGDLVSLRRVFELEQRVNHWLVEQTQHGLISEGSQERGEANKALGLAFLKQARSYITQLFDFSSLNAEEIDYQAQAVAQSLLSNVLLVSGGPGTGKTTTAAQIILMRLLKARHRLNTRQANHSGDANLYTVCLAPTGKAAHRLASSLQQRAAGLINQLEIEADEKAQLLSALPGQGKTIHRYLIEQGVPIEDFSSEVFIPDNERVFARAELDHGMDPTLCGKAPTVVIIDESSMIDLALMDRLLSVLDRDSSIVFLGDHHQLPAVELGDVFARWVALFDHGLLAQQQWDQLAACLAFDCSALPIAPSEEQAWRMNPLVTLRKSYRFTGVLAECAEIVRDGSSSQILSWLETNTSDVVRFNRLSSEKLNAEGVVSDVLKAYASYGECIKSKPSLSELQSRFDQYQVLCSTRTGPIGTEQLNLLINEQIMRLACAGVKDQNASQHYHGLPVLLERNFTHLDLFNGDVGFFIDKGEGRFVVAFYRGEGAEAVEVLPSQLPQYELAYAMTIHKSQGSEYDAVSIVVAPYAQELVSRALIYTGLTRAKTRADLHIAQACLLALPN